MAWRKENGNYINCEKIVVYANGACHVTFNVYQNEGQRKSFDKQFDNKLLLSGGCTLSADTLNTMLSEIYAGVTALSDDTVTDTLENC